MFSYDLIGTKTGPFEFSYTWKDIILYALSIGAGAGEEDDLYTYEKNLKAFPTFACTLQPISPISLPKRTVSDLTGMLHMENELIQHIPLDPRGGKLFYETSLEKLYDKGEGKGSKMIMRTGVYNEFGDLVAENIDSMFSKADGGWGGEFPPKNTNNMPEREPDIEEEVTPPESAPLLYRLASKDCFPIHVDKDFARAGGFERPIMHGLCTYGYGCRILIKNLFHGEPERLKRINGCFMKSLYPGDPIKVQIWKISDNEARWQIVNVKTGEIPIGKGVLEWR